MGHTLRYELTLGSDRERASNGGTVMVTVIVQTVVDVVAVLMAISLVVVNVAPMAKRAVLINIIYNNAFTLNTSAAHSMLTFRKIPRVA